MITTATLARRALSKLFRLNTTAILATMADSQGQDAGAEHSARTVDNQNITSDLGEHPQTIPDTPAGKAKLPAPQGRTQGNSNESESMGTALKSGPSSPVSDAPPSPSALSSTSSSSSAADMPPPSTITPSGDLLQPLKAKGWSFTKSKWISKYRCDKEVPTELRLLTWNIDFSAADCRSRTMRILLYLQKTALSSTPPPSCILLQEVNTWSLSTLIFHPWVRKHYVMTPPTTEPWKSHYGNVTLVSRSIPFKNPQILVFRNSTMGRTAVFVDIPIRSPTTGKIRTVRIANTHLESLPQGTKMRPTQLAAIAAMLRADGIDGGVVAGDMNMIGDTADQNIHIAAGLDDACLFPHDPANHTWGYQPSTRFPPRRLDRVFFTGEKVVVNSPEVIGKGLRTAEGMWASDHCGLSTTVFFTD